MRYHTDVRTDVVGMGCVGMGIQTHMGIVNKVKGAALMNAVDSLEESMGCGSWDEDIDKGIGGGIHLMDRPDPDFDPDLESVPGPDFDPDLESVPGPDFDPDLESVPDLDLESVPDLDPESVPDPDFGPDLESVPDLDLESVPDPDPDPGWDNL